MKKMVPFKMLKITYTAESPRTISRSGHNQWKSLTKQYELFGEKTLAEILGTFLTYVET